MRKPLTPEQQALADQRKAREYNGWTNYETWVVNLWMSNDQTSDEHFRDLAKQTYSEATAEKRSDGSILFTRKERATLTLADVLKDGFEEQQSQLVGVTGMFADLLGAALSEVHWYEIAQHLVSDIEPSTTNDNESEAA